MPIFIALTPAATRGETSTQKLMYRVESIDSFEDADVNGFDYTYIRFNKSSHLEDVVVEESYEDIWKTLNNLNLVQEVVKE